MHEDVDEFKTKSLQEIEEWLHDCALF